MAATLPAAAAVTFADLAANVASTGISTDGSAIALNSVPAGTAYIWTKTNGLVSIGSGSTAGVGTRFGTIVVGGNVGGNAYRWDGDATGAGAWTQLPLEGINSWTALCTGVSAGDVWIGGFSGDTTGFKQCCRYSESRNSTAGLSLPLGGGNNDSYLYGASDNGLFAGQFQFGAVAPSGSRQAMCGLFNDPMNPNNPNNNRMIILNNLLGEPSYSTEASARAISRDGARIGGWSQYHETPDGFRQAVWWTFGLAHGAKPIPFMGADNYAETQALNSNGTICAGYSAYWGGPGTSLTNRRCWIWDATNGTRDLMDILTDAGIDMTGWTLTNVTGMSGNATVITGNGTKDDVAHAWLITMTKPLVGINNKAAWDAIMANGRLTFEFVIWGRVLEDQWSFDSFVLDDGSGAPIQVNAPGHNVLPGQYARAKGRLSTYTGVPIMLSTAEDVWYY